MVKKILSFVKFTIVESFYIIRCGAPLSIVFLYLIHKSRVFRKGYRFSVKKNYSVLKKYKKESNKLDVTHDWFTHCIPYWVTTIEKYLKPYDNLNALEIGAFEGRSAHFLCWYSDKTNLVCVDTWQNLGENEGTNYVAAAIEERFDHNVKEFGSRIKKFKGTSLSYFLSVESQKKQYDFIYIDGSHQSDDVIIDAIKCFKLLKVGGIMIFDDFLWKYYEYHKNNPCSAISAFLALKKSELRIIYLGYQVHVLKLAAFFTHRQ